MKRILRLSLGIMAICLISLTQVYSQQKKHELKDNTFYTDGKAMFTLDEMKNNRTGNTDIILKNIEGQRVILFEAKETAEKIAYYEVHFLTNNSIAETKIADLTTIGQLVSENQLIKDGKLNIEAERKFITANQNKFTKPATK
jgi:hypothetical protein